MTRPAHALDLRWLLTLRWAAIAGQIVTIVGVQQGLGLALPLLPLGLIIAGEAATNGVAQLLLRRGPRTGERAALGLLAVDVVALTGLLYFTGGPHNPFNFLYLVHIALAAVVLRPAATWGLAALSAAAFGALFFDSVPLGALSGGEAGLDATHAGHAAHAAAQAVVDPHAGHAAHAAAQAVVDPHAGHAGHAMGAVAADSMDLHLRGRWVAFTVGAAFIAYFVSRVKSALAEREEALLAARETAERADRLASLATLAAGAAHELATPLATIAIAARELELELGQLGLAVADDARLIRSQVVRCRDVLDQLGVDAGNSRGSALETVSVDDMIAQSLLGVSGADRVDVTLDAAVRQRLLPGFRSTLVQTLRGVLRNALDASPDGARVSLRGTAMNGAASLVVVDGGAGMDATTLARATEPFFTTNGVGRGMGLGLFLARSVLEQLGGGIALSSEPGHGTTVTLTIPSVPPTSRAAAPSSAGSPPASASPVPAPTAHSHAAVSPTASPTASSPDPPLETS